jgi:hypothetical protein
MMVGGVYLLIKSIQLDNSRRSRQNLQLKTFRGATPLGCADVAAVERESIATARWAPAQTTFSKLAFSRLL